MLAVLLLCLSSVLCISCRGTETPEQASDTINETATAAMEERSPEMQQLAERMTGPYGDSELTVLTRNGAIGPCGHAAQAGSLGDLANPMDAICFSPITSTAYHLCRDPLCNHNVPKYDRDCPFNQAANFYWLNDTVLVYTYEKWYATDETMELKGETLYRYDVKKILCSYDVMTEKTHEYRSEETISWVNREKGTVVSRQDELHDYQFLNNTAYYIEYAEEESADAEVNVYSAAIMAVDLLSGKISCAAKPEHIQDVDLRILDVKDGNMYLLNPVRKKLYRMESDKLVPLCENLMLSSGDGVYIRDGMLYIGGSDLDDPLEDGRYERCLYRIDLATGKYEQLFRSPLAFAMTNDYLFIIQIPEDENWAAGMPLVRYTPDGQNPVTLTRIQGDGYVQMDESYGELYILSASPVPIRYDLATGILYYMNGKPIPEE